jgi:sugar/nucleoside kinase (ribokinase family)
VLEALPLLIEYFKLEACLVTLGEHGLYAGTQKGEKIYSPGYQTQVRDLIGAGDACTAGFCAGMLSGLSFKECCRLGNMVGALSTTKAGGLSPISTEDLSAFQNSPPPRLSLDILARIGSGIFQID